MAGTVWLFIDEFGDASFSRNGSKHFGLASVPTSEPEEVARAMERLHHEWLSEHHSQRGYFHAHQDCWDVRSAVCDLFPSLPVTRFDVLALAKEVVFSDRRTPDLLYGTAARELLRFVVPHLGAMDRLVVVVADWRPQVRHVGAIVRRVLAEEPWQDRTVWSGALSVVQVPSAAHAGVQLADYVGWAFNRMRARKEAQWVDRLTSGGLPWSAHTAFD